MAFQLNASIPTKRLKTCCRPKSFQNTPSRTKNPSKTIKHHQKPMIFIDFSMCFLVNSTAAMPRAPPIPPPRKSAAPPPAPPRHGRRSVAVPGAFGAGGWKGGRWGQNPWKILLRVSLYIYVVSENRLKSEIAPLKIRIGVCRPAFRQSQEL